MGLRVSPYSLCSIDALTKAVAVWPDGHELRVLPSGRISCAVYLMELTKPAMMAYDMAVEARNRHVSLRPSTPAKLSPAASTAGANCV